MSLGSWAKTGEVGLGPLDQQNLDRFTVMKHQVEVGAKHCLYVGVESVGHMFVSKILVGHCGRIHLTQPHVDTFVETQRHG